MQKYLLVCVLILGCASGDETLDEDDVQQVQQFAAKGSHLAGFQYNPGVNLANLFNRSQQGQGSQRTWNENQGSWNQFHKNQASWNQSQQSWNQNQNWNQAQGGWNQVQGQTGQSQTGWNQGQNSQSHGWNQVQQGGNGTLVGRNTTGPVDLEVGVCYIEVPTARLVQDQQHVPTGNGSRPDLSVIRSCCQGYIRNIHNFRKCDPVCSQECVNALCTAPETCTCFPDHIKNLAGFCIPVCPIGCQNGLCEGNKCTCKPGYKLNVDSKFCVPECKGNCGGLGNCTAPDTCECKPGYHSTPDGSCKPHCDKCENGDCVSPNVCNCHQGFAKDKDGKCAPLCGPGFQMTPQGCKPICDKCTNGDCVGPNNCQCHQGYVKQNNLCAPSCNPNCGPLSRCVSPNVCVPLPHLPDPEDVYPGRYNPNRPQQNSGNPNTTGGQCSPSQPCVNGVCVENRCQCNPGYVIASGAKDCDPSTGCVSSNVCVPIPHLPDPEDVYPGRYYPNLPQPNSDDLHGNPNTPGGQCSPSQPCLNGVCVGNRCQCNPGYVIDRSDASGTKCIPYCSGGCPNGVCSAPNFCICNMGYVKDNSVKGRPTCVKRVRRSAEPQPDEKKSINVAELLIFEIPDYNEVVEENRN